MRENNLSTSPAKNNDEGEAEGEEFHSKKRDRSNTEKRE